MAITVAARASLALNASTNVDPQEVLKLVKKASGKVKGGGASLLTTGLQNLGAEVHVEREARGRLEISINSGRRIFELCTFSATASATASDGGTVTRLRVGGLETYKTTQTKTLFIPTGPKMIAGMAPYKRFLEAIAADLRAVDPLARIAIAQRDA
ncbi:hypothetical protein EDD29_8545 [Actinocorallia herbida]|uniref:Uncharacterized protein n=1 Tax=Actinocorallia herbida TaxID=58109 RepID=A0A3N1DBF8_9ACTN|nr:hypothetical protein [Actinocorallia herbida]ROO90806.1 hypothetical protein EDD29_8545 [Actinocorallia herbida]